MQAESLQKSSSPSSSTSSTLHVFVKHLEIFVDILKMTRTGKFSKWSSATVNKAFMWSDFIGESVRASELSLVDRRLAVQSVDRTGVAAIDKDRLLLLDNPLNCLAIAIFSSPYLYQTQNLVVLLLSHFSERLGQSCAISLCSSVLQTVLDQRSDVFQLLSDMHLCKESVSIFSAEDDMLALLLMSGATHHKCITGDDPLLEAADNSDYIFMLLCKAVTFAPSKVLQCYLSLQPDMSMNLSACARVEASYRWVLSTIAMCIIHDASKATLIFELGLLDSLLLVNAREDNTVHEALLAAVSSMLSGACGDDATKLEQLRTNLLIRHCNMRTERKQGVGLAR